MKPHKHAEILRAIADGKKVEWRTVHDNTWNETDYYNPITNHGLEWRIKPEPKPDIVCVRKAAVTYNSDLYIAVLDRPNLRLTFDGETRELKAAEVLK